MGNNVFEPACNRMEWLDPFYKQVWQKAYKDAIPISGTFELTPRCNFNCKMCYVHLDTNDIWKHGQEMGAREWLRIAEEAKQAGTTWLCITGGEPMLHPEFAEIWTELSQMGFFITLQTNGSLISGNNIELLEKYPPKRVKITLYGTDDNVYQSVCGVENGFTRVDEGLRTLMSMKVPISLVSTIIQQNKKDIRKMAFYAYQHRLPWNVTAGIRPALRVKERDNSSVIVQEYLEESKRNQIRRCLQENRLLDIERKPCTYCRDYRVGYWVLWDGSVRFCSFMDTPEISVRKIPFLEAWEQLVNYEDKLDWPEECKKCKASKVCVKCAATIRTQRVGEERVDNTYCSNIRVIFEEVLSEMDEEIYELYKGTE